jgi:hypothetical protein
MSIRWYTVVIDPRDVAAQSRWWAQVLDWRIVYEAADEVVVVPPHAIHPDRTIPPRPSGPGGSTSARIRTRSAGSSWPTPRANEFCVLSARD